MNINVDININNFACIKVRCIISTAECGFLLQHLQAETFRT